MRNVLNIILHDFRRLTASVVGIVILLGLIVIPSVFTWFNILSNWDPFEKEATGNIPIAVVIEDDGRLEHRDQSRAPGHHCHAAAFAFGVGFAEGQHVVLFDRHLGFVP